MPTELDCVYLSATVATMRVSSTPAGRGAASAPAVWNSSGVTSAVLRFWLMVKPKTSRDSSSAGS